MQIKYCPNCGKRLNGSEKFCSNCGFSFTGSQYSNQQNKTNHNTSTFIWVVAFVISAIIIGISLSSNDIPNTWSKSNKVTKVSNLFQGKKTTYSIQSIKDVDKMRKAIDNTIWTYTKPGDLFWLKMEFKGDKVRLYNALPSDGKWTFEEECPYYLEEGRFIDDGRRYIAAVIKTKDLSVSPKFVITNGHLSWLGFIDAGGFVLGDYEWD